MLCPPADFSVKQAKYRYMRFFPISQREVFGGCSGFLAQYALWRWSGGSSGRAVGYQVGGLRFESHFGPSQFSIAPLRPPALNGLLGLLRLGKVKAARKATANYLIMPYAKNNQDPTPGSTMHGLSVGPFLLLFIRCGSLDLRFVSSCDR
ncbi:hypothetical protein PoB_001590100 [Plakobranchus ocellatus]|uniref:Uncharacterized protein n=1 Tax=Plakobranchus ocellatus TaxID=259542 RepID=A0AAV3Z491_9GAST|nr:hypothetical protein PoB_001590100 [Plakobranchus ocellatus]